MNGPKAKKVIVYSRKECHLCWDALAVINSVREHIPFEVEVVDIESDDALMLKWLERIPVVEVDGEVWFEFEVDPDRFARLLSGADSI